MQVISRIPTAQYAYVEFQGTVEEFEKLTPKQVGTIMKGHVGGSKVYKVVTMTAEDRFEAELDNDIAKGIK